MHVSEQNVHELKRIIGCNFPRELWWKLTESIQIICEFVCSCTIECETSKKLQSFWCFYFHRMSKRLRKSFSFPYNENCQRFDFTCAIALTGVLQKLLLGVRWTEGTEMRTPPFANEAEEDEERKTFLFDFTGELEPKHTHLPNTTFSWFKKKKPKDFFLTLSNRMNWWLFCVWKGNMIRKHISRIKNKRRSSSSKKEENFDWGYEDIFSARKTSWFLNR